jgi:hypothetical protein
MCSFGADLRLNPTGSRKDILWALRGIIARKINGDNISSHMDELLALTARVVAESDTELRRLWGAAMILAGFAPSLVADTLR